MSGLISALQQDHLYELIRGQELPLPALDPLHVELILELLQRAYEGIKADHPGAVSSGDEKHLNSLMVDRLNHLVGDDPMASLLVRAVSRGSETKNYNASRFEMRPDIQISLTSRQHLFPLIVECKIIDKPKGKTVDLYCRDGLARFTTGDYAWTNREAMLLAYVRDGAGRRAISIRFLLRRRHCHHRNTLYYRFHKNARCRCGTPLDPTMEDTSHMCMGLTAVSCLAILLCGICG